MERNSELYRKYVELMKSELIPAMGCTEPIAISFTAARAKEILGREPEKVLVKASGNLIKNVKSVIVPNTDGLKGIEAAAAAGIIAGKPEKKLEVISEVSAGQKEQIREFLKKDIIKVEHYMSDHVFDLVVILWAGDDTVSVRITDEHTNIVHEEKNGVVLLDKPLGAGAEAEAANSFMSVDGILNFAKTCDIDDVREIISRQIEYNSAISEEGLKNDWGANVGKVLFKYNNAADVKIRAQAKAAAGSDARMSGCEMPVVINSGSGNQGIAVSIPILEYAKELNSTEEELYRALIMANLLGLHQKEGIGRLSAYCGAVSAGCAAGAGIAYLQHRSEWVIRHTIANCLAITSGIVCDGAKPSCAAKIAESVNAALLALDMAEDGQQFKGGEGIIKKGIENTIASVARLGRDGMKETDKEILDIMIN